MPGLSMLVTLEFCGVISRRTYHRPDDTYLYNYRNRVSVILEYAYLQFSAPNRRLNFNIANWKRITANFQGFHVNWLDRDDGIV